MPYLFFETIENIQRRLTEKVLDINRDRQTKEGFAESMKEFFREAVHTANLNLKMEESKAYGILSALLSTINAKETLSVTCDYFAVFDFMVENLIADIFE